MSYDAFEVKDDIRLMIAGLRDTDPSLSPMHAQEAVDLGIHAANEAALAIDRVCHRSSDDAVIVYAIQAAFRVMDAYMRAKIATARMVVEAMGEADEPPVNLH